MMATSPRAGTKSKNHLETLIDIYRMRSYERNLHYHDKLVECLSKFDFFTRRTDFTDGFRVISDVSEYLKLKPYKAGDIVYEKDDNSHFLAFALSGLFAKYEHNTPTKTEPSQNRYYDRPQTVSNADNLASKQLGITKTSTDAAGSENSRQFRLHTSRKTLGSNTPATSNNLTLETPDGGSGKSPTSLLSSLSNLSPTAYRFQLASVRNLKEQHDLASLVRLNNNLSKFFSDDCCLVNKTKVINAGESFGERGVSLGEQRTKSVICLADGIVLTLSVEYFRRFFQKGAAEVEGDKVYFLKSLLKDISIEKAKQIAQYLEEVTIQPRTVIFSATDSPDALYFVKSGKVHNQPQGKKFEEDNLYRSKESEDSADSKRESQNKKKLSAFCSVGNLDFFGEEMFYKRSGRQYTSISDCTTVLYKITSKAIKKCEGELQEITNYIQAKSTMQAGIKGWKLKENTSKKSIKREDSPPKSAEIFKTNVKLATNQSGRSSSETSRSFSDHDQKRFSYEKGYPVNKISTPKLVDNSLREFKAHKNFENLDEKPECSFFSNPNDSFLALINTENNLERPTTKQQVHIRADTYEDSSAVAKITAFWESHQPRKQLSPDFRNTETHFVRPSTKAAPIKPGSKYEMTTQRIATGQGKRIHFNGTVSSRPSTSKQVLGLISPRDLQGLRIMTSALSVQGNGSKARFMSLTARSNEAFNIRRNQTDNAKVSLVIKSFAKTPGGINHMQTTSSEHFANFQPLSLNDPLESGILKNTTQKKQPNIDAREAYYMGMISPSLTFTNQFFQKTSQSNTMHFPSATTPNSLDTRLKAVLYRKIR